VMEERRMRTDSQPIGRLIEQFLAAAFTHTRTGSRSSAGRRTCKSFSATDAAEFYGRYYVPANTTLAVVGT